ncbi:MAG: hypothetical protein LUO89_13785 [Methanothrix sp.]|nr:hypothetical protein [Methanothrix sp.]
MILASLGRPIFEASLAGVSLRLILPINRVTLGAGPERKCCASTATVISAMGAGKIASADMNEWLKKDGNWS